MRMLATFAAALLLSWSAAAADLVMGISRGPASMDPHFYNGTADKNVAAHVFDRLVEMSAAVTPVPGLALSWTPVSDTEWEFALRPGVTWHDGVPFTADDVAFTLARAGDVPNSPGGFAPVLRSIAAVRVTGPLTLRIVTDGPAPNLPIDLSNVAIVSRHAGEGATTAEYNGGKAAIGTGPYRFAGFAFESSVELVRNDRWWGPAQDWEHVRMRVIANPAARTAALLAGDVDLIDLPNPEDLPRLSASPQLRVVSAPGTRVFYLMPDTGRTGPSPFVTDAEGRPLPSNPLRDVRVRRALALAINQPALCDRVLQGTGVPTGQWMWPGAYSYAAAVGLPPYDPARARALLAEAGLPRGFRLVLHTADGPNQAAVAQAVAQMWTRVGVATEVTVVPGAMFYSRANRHEYSMASGNWGSNSGEAGYLLRNVLGSAPGWGPFNMGGYANPALDTLTREALATLDAAAREAILVRAVEMAMADEAIIPLYQAKNVWASRRGVRYEARPDQRTVAMAAHRE
jgi:peptide/nickel transport system substrate-binding protein